MLAADLGSRLVSTAGSLLDRNSRKLKDARSGSLRSLLTESASSHPLGSEVQMSFSVRNFTSFGSSFSNRINSFNSRSAPTLVGFVIRMDGCWFAEKPDESPKD